MLRRYWSLPDATPMATFQKGIKEIAEAEHVLGVTVAARILNATAQEFFAEHHRCPFCGMLNQLHLSSQTQPEGPSPMPCAPVGTP